MLGFLFCVYSAAKQQIPWLSPSGGCATLSFDQGVPKKLPTTAPSSQSERHLTVFYIDQIVPGFVVYYLNCIHSGPLSCLMSFISA